MEKRVRSPNYPAISLPDAIQKVTALYKQMHTHAAPREVIAKGMGYNSLNGASATAISALHKYGLLEKSGDEVKVSERALCILHPHSPHERRAAIRQAAVAPPLFAELAERFPDKLPNEELLRNYLVRKGFAPSAVSSVILAYRETSLFAEEATDGYDSGASPHPEDDPMMSNAPAASAPTVAQHIAHAPQGAREIAGYSFEGGGFVRIIAGGPVETEEALDMVDTLTDLKRKELDARKKRETKETANLSSGLENSEDGTENIS